VFGSTERRSFQGIELVRLMLERGGDHLLEGPVPVGESERSRGGHAASS
jgi:hypothetical protein